MSILHIQEYLRSGKSLLDLTIEYNINAFDSIKYPNLVAFDYTALSPKTKIRFKKKFGRPMMKDMPSKCTVHLPIMMKVIL